MIKNYAYKDVDGDHWPDKALGSEEFYSIDFSPWLAGQNDTIQNVEWILPENVTGSDAFEDGTEAFIKLAFVQRGSFPIQCNMTSLESGREQTKVVKMIIKVY